MPILFQKDRQLTAARPGPTNPLFGHVRGIRLRADEP